MPAAVRGVLALKNQAVLTPRPVNVRSEVAPVGADLSAWSTKGPVGLAAREICTRAHDQHSTCCEQSACWRVLTTRPVTVAPRGAGVATATVMEVSVLLTRAGGAGVAVHGDPRGASVRRGRCCNTHPACRASGTAPSLTRLTRPPEGWRPPRRASAGQASAPRGRARSTRPGSSTACRA